MAVSEVRSTNKQFESAKLATTAVKTITLPPGATETAYSFVNLRGHVCVAPTGRVEAWWIYTGTNYPIQVIDHQTCLDFDNKVNGDLRLHNPGQTAVTVNLTEDSRAADPLETVDGVVGSAMGGPNSEAQKLHRAIKDLLRFRF